MTVVQGVLLDLDGTLYQDGAAIPGAVEAVARLRHAGLPLRFLTNTSRRARGAVLDDLTRMGFTATLDELLTAPAVAAAWLRRAGIRRISLAVPQETQEDFDGFTHDDRAPEAVVVGDLGRAWTFDRLNALFALVHGGARLVAVQKNRYWRQGGELVLDAGPFVAALEYAAGADATVVGKPARAFFLTAVESLGLTPDAVCMVGDDAASDAGGAMAAGLTGMLVRTGKYRPGDEESAAGAQAVDSVADVPDLLGVPR